MQCIICLHKDFVQMSSFSNVGLCVYLLLCVCIHIYIDFIYLFVLEIDWNGERTATKNCSFGSNIGCYTVILFLDSQGLLTNRGGNPSIVECQISQLFFLIAQKSSFALHEVDSIEACTLDVKRCGQEQPSVGRERKEGTTRYHKVPLVMPPQKKLCGEAARDGEMLNDVSWKQKMAWSWKRCCAISQGLRWINANSERWKWWLSTFFTWCLRLRHQNVGTFASTITTNSSLPKKNTTWNFTAKGGAILWVSTSDVESTSWHEASLQGSIPW